VEIEIRIMSLVPVAHTCKPSYSGGRDQEDSSSKPAQANSWQDPILKKTITKRAGGVGSRCRPSVQTPVPPKKTKRKERNQNNG
jgi:hypothetical protein